MGAKEGWNWGLETPELQTGQVGQFEGRRCVLRAGCSVGYKAMGAEEARARRTRDGELGGLGGQTEGA